MIKSVIFDIDGTLYDYNAAHAVAMNRLTAYAGSTLGLAPERFHALHQQMFDRQKARLGRCAAIHNRLIRYQMLLEAIGKPVSHAPEMAELYWSTLINRMRPLPGATETLAQLRFMGLTVGIGSNMTADWQYAKLKRLGLMTYVDFIVTSEEAGVEKPDAGLFALCAEKARCAANECAFVGDSLEDDALGALNAGMHAVWLCADAPADIPQGIARIAAFSELQALLQSF